MREYVECEHCGEDIAPEPKGRIPRFCSVRCRMAAHRESRITNIPAELMIRNRWVRWKSFNGKKLPITLDAGMASSTNPDTWTNYSHAFKSRLGDGLGFVLNGDGIMCIDLDYCVVDGEPNQLALDFIESLPETYIEFSPSGDGLHIWGFGSMEKGSRQIINGLHIEQYASGRYMTITNKPFMKAPLAQLT